MVTREQFERLADALQPNMAAPIKLRLATAYSRLIGMSKEAEKRGLDKTPKFEANMTFARMQILSQQLTGTLQEESQQGLRRGHREILQRQSSTPTRKPTCSGSTFPHTKQMPPPPAKAAAVKKDKRHRRGGNKRHARKPAKKR